MGRAMVWGTLGAFLSWSVAAVVVSGVEAGAPYLVAASAATLATAATRLFAPEISRVREERMMRSRTDEDHLHAGESFTEL
jgi:hypothetical protein